MSWVVQTYLNTLKTQKMHTHKRHTFDQSDHPILLAPAQLRDEPMIQAEYLG